MKLDEKHIFQRIKKFETEENIITFNSSYGNLWPIFKMYISRNLQNAPSKIKYRGNAYRTLSAIKTHLSTIKNYKFKKFEKLHVNPNIEEIWFSNHELRYENNNNYNKYLDPFFIELSVQNSIIYEGTLNYSKEYSFPHLKEKSNIKNLTPVFLRYDNISLIKKLFSVYKNEYCNFKKRSFAKTLTEHFPDCELFPLFLEYLYFIKNYKFYTSFFNKHTSLKKVYIVAYYMTSRMAIMAAANNKHIETIDIQHSIISKMHYAYGAWNFIPAGGYNLLPSTIYVFSKKEETLLHEVFQKQHKIKIIENYTHKHWILTKTSKKEIKKNTILISLQNTTIPQSSFLLKALLKINTNRKDIKIVFRIHPRHIYIKDELNKTLNKINLQFSWDKNSEIYDTLSETLINITSFSSVVEDALLFKTPSIIFSEKGIKIFKNEINNNPMVYSALNKIDLLKIINKYI
ncbi:MAG: hypothetical protein K8R54_18035 [Bacteroidales bacterium]|nr:hypothetical protein [Bacteroidales bacterium]